MKNKYDNSEIKIRKIPKFGVLDAVIILLVVVAIVGIYFRYHILDFVSNAKNLSNYSVTYSIDDMRYTTPNYITVGDKVYFSSNKEQFGTLATVSENMGVLSITPASEFFTTSTGEIVEAFYPNSESRVSAVGRLNCVGRYSDDGGFLVNGSVYISAGQYVEIYTEKVTVTIRINEINLAEETTE